MKLRCYDHQMLDSKYPYQVVTTMLQRNLYYTLTNLFITSRSVLGGCGCKSWDLRSGGPRFASVPLLFPTRECPGSTQYAKWTRGQELEI